MRLPVRPTQLHSNPRNSALRKSWQAVGVVHIRPRQARSQPGRSSRSRFRAGPAPQGIRRSQSPRRVEPSRRKAPYADGDIVVTESPPSGSFGQPRPRGPRMGPEPFAGGIRQRSGSSRTGGRGFAERRTSPTGRTGTAAEPTLASPLGAVSAVLARPVRPCVRKLPPRPSRGHENHEDPACRCTSDQAESRSQAGSAAPGLGSQRGSQNLNTRTTPAGPWWTDPPLAELAIGRSWTGLDWRSKSTDQKVGAKGAIRTPAAGKGAQAAPGRRYVHDSRRPRELMLMRGASRLAERVARVPRARQPGWTHSYTSCLR